MLLLAAGLLAGCSAVDNPPQPETQKEIRLDAALWQIMQGAPSRRVSTYDDVDALQDEGSFTAAVYVANSTTAYISPVTVNWDNTNSKWVFSDGKHYWPASGSLDFFAYMPAEVPDYITSGPTYTTARNPQFTCTDLPLTYDCASPTAGQGSGLQEFILAMTTGRTKALDGADGVTMTFKHPFAKIKFQLSSATTTNVTVNNISMEGLVTSGSCSFDGATSTWTSQSGSETMTLTVELQRYATEGTPWLLMIPNNYGSKNLSVNVTWTEWDEEYTRTYTTPLTINWVAGYSYTYNLTITRNELIVDVAKYTEQW